MRLRIAFISPVPPAACGVVNYTATLAEHLERLDLDVRIVSSSGWGATYSRHLLASIQEDEPDIIHIQYPTAPYGKGLAPQITALLLRSRPLVVTLHEFSQSHVLRRMAEALFTLADRLVFTNSFEAEVFSRWFPWVRERVQSIPIGSDLPLLPTVENRILNNRVIFFGLFRPNKGLEEFVALARLAQDARRPYEFAAIGTPQTSTVEYYHALRQRAHELNNLSWHVSLDGTAVADMLRHASAAYLHFPDGASERRSSLLAALGSGVVTLTTWGLQTPDSLKEVVLMVREPEEALRILDWLFLHVDEWARLQRVSLLYAANFNWNAIAHRHVELYQKLLTNRRRVKQ